MDTGEAQIVSSQGILHALYSQKPKSLYVSSCKVNGWTPPIPRVQHQEVLIWEVWPSPLMIDWKSHGQNSELEFNPLTWSSGFSTKF